jgi:hypothetical protein
MSNVVQAIPEALKPEVDAALAWLNAENGAQFEVSGIVDPERTLAQPADGVRDLSLVLCQGDLCVREQLRVERGRAGIECRRANVVSHDPPAELDPREGVRSGWIDEQLAKHAFVVLVFYRGFW